MTWFQPLASSHPSGNRADPTERSLNSAVRSGQYQQAPRTAEVTSSSETSIVPFLVNSFRMWYLLGGISIPSISAKSIFWRSKTERFFQERAQPQKSPMTNFS